MGESIWHTSPQRSREGGGDAWIWCCVIRRSVARSKEQTGEGDPCQIRNYRSERSTPCLPSQHVGAALAVLVAPWGRRRRPIGLLCGHPRPLLYTEYYSVQCPIKSNQGEDSRVSVNALRVLAIKRSVVFSDHHDDYTIKNKAGAGRHGRSAEGGASMPACLTTTTPPD